jgi:acetylornithine/succinyldiaminopimelate/putrescine aminotransferase
LMGSETFKNAFRPLLPGTRQLAFNAIEALQQITTQTAAVFAEPIQGEAGVIAGTESFLKALRQRCDETGTLLVFDEIQTGFGRTGKLFAFEHYGIIPDILLCAKGMGGGMPLGAFITSRERMNLLSHDPVLGHLTTFGGHPVSCAAGLASLEVLEQENLLALVPQKERLFTALLKHPLIQSVRSAGLLLAVDFGSEALNRQVLALCMERELLADWFLFNSQSMRIAPPLTITEEEIHFSCKVILESLALCNP